MAKNRYNNDYKIVPVPPSLTTTPSPTTPTSSYIQYNGSSIQFLPEVGQVSISSTFFSRVFRTKVHSNPNSKQRKDFRTKNAREKRWWNWLQVDNTTSQMYCLINGGRNILTYNETTMMDSNSGLNKEPWFCLARKWVCLIFYKFKDYKLSKFPIFFGYNIIK